MQSLGTFLQATAVAVSLPRQTLRGHGGVRVRGLPPQEQGHRDGGADRGPQGFQQQTALQAVCF